MESIADSEANKWSFRALSSLALEQLSRAVPTAGCALMADSLCRAVTGVASPEELSPTEKRVLALALERRYWSCRDLEEHARIGCHLDAVEGNNLGSRRDIMG